MVGSGELKELSQGGFLARNGVLLITGCEIESREGVHLIVYLPDLTSIHKWQEFFQSRIHNMELSTQKARSGIIEILNLTLLLNGIFCPAHVFTPHKGIYGMLTRRLATELGTHSKKIKVLEIGLSADTDMADCIAETRGCTFITNSDAHSSPNIGREYNLLRMAAKNFEELRKCLENRKGRGIEANYGLHPRLGKYHRSYCLNCERILEGNEVRLKCNHCNSTNIVMGVYDRILEIRDYDTPRHPVGRPPYHYRVPLRDLPGVGPKTYGQLLRFYNEIELLEKVEISKIEKIAGVQIASTIEDMRNNSLEIIAGGGGKYGEVKKHTHLD